LLLLNPSRDMLKDKPECIPRHTIEGIRRSKKSKCGFRLVQSLLAAALWQEGGGCSTRCYNWSETC